MHTRIFESFTCMQPSYRFKPKTRRWSLGRATSAANHLTILQPPWLFLNFACVRVLRACTVAGGDHKKALCPLDLELQEVVSRPENAGNQTPQVLPAGNLTAFYLSFQDRVSWTWSLDLVLGSLLPIVFLCWSFMGAGDPVSGLTPASTSPTENYRHPQTVKILKTK